MVTYLSICTAPVSCRPRPRNVEDEAIGQRGVDLVGVVRRLSSGADQKRSPKCPAPFRSAARPATSARCPRPARSESCSRDCRSQIPCRTEFDLLRGHVECLAGNLAELATNFFRGLLRGDSRRRTEPAGIVAGSNRPGIALGIALHVAAISCGSRPSCSATIWLRIVAWPWPCGRLSAVTLTAPRHQHSPWHKRRCRPWVRLYGVPRPGRSC